MIIFLFLAMLVGTLMFGAWLAVRSFVNGWVAADARAEASDEAENGWAL